MNVSELTDLLILMECPRLSKKDVGRIVLQAGSASAIFSTPSAVLRSWGLKKDTIQAIEAHSISPEIEKQLEFIDKHSIRVMMWNDPQYPQLLRMCPDAPILLYGRGDFDLNPSRPIISVVGSRAITPYGASAIEDIISALAPYGPMIVSGLAAGVDVHAHRAALKHSLPTVGVLGQGLGTPLYPAENKETAREMCNTQGCGVLTEYHHLMMPLPGLFPMRNRIVAGMSMATIVIEAKIHGGALITAHLASDYNRDVFALPGRTIDPCSAGCNALIRANKAIILDSPQTIIDELAWEMDKKTAIEKKDTQTVMFADMDDEEKRVAEVLSPHERLHIDELCAQMGVLPHQVAGLLLTMELKGFVESLPGKYYALAPAMRA